MNSSQRCFMEDIQVQLDSLLAKYCQPDAGIAGDLAYMELQGIFEQKKASALDLCNRWALSIAERFDVGAMAYQQADCAANVIWSLMIHALNDIHDGTIAYSIYEAFDAGEFDHGDGKDPVETYTKPMIKHILKSLRQK